MGRLAGRRGLSRPDRARPAEPVDASEPAPPAGAEPVAATVRCDVEVGGEEAAGAAGTLHAGHLQSVAFAVVALLAYQLAAARHPVEWDGAQLVLGLDRFDVTNGTPHPPGYWLYIAVGRLIRATTPLDGTASLTVVASLAASVTVGLVDALGRAVGGRLVGAVAAALVASSPFAWFYGASVGTYALDALACAVLVTLAWHARPGGAQGVWAAVALGSAAGFRQTSLLVFAPVAVVAVARSARSARTWLLSGCAGAAAIAAWLVPMLAEQPGGFPAWRAASDALLRGSVDQTAFYVGTYDAVTRNMTQGATYAAVAFLPALVVACVAWITGAGRRWQRRDGRGGGTSGRAWWASSPAILAAGALPALAFLVLIHFGKAGYLLAALPAGVLLLVLPLASVAPRWNAVVAGTALLVVAVSTGRFLVAPGIVPASLVDATPLFVTSSANGAPFRFSRSAIVESDRRTTSELALRDRFDPARDVLVWGWLNGGERYRQATLALPEFTASFVRDARHVHTARAGRWRTDPDTTLEVPPGGRAVFVLAHVPPDLQALLDAGRAEAVRLPTGPTVWVVGPGVTLLGVQVVEGDTAVGPA